MDTLVQRSPWPQDLEDIVDGISYLDGWNFHLFIDYDRGQGSLGTTLVITVTTADAYHESDTRPTNHLFIVPAAAYNYSNWQRWVYDRIMDVHRHEAGENLVINGVRPYAPNHGPGEDPYITREFSTDEQRRTSFRGVVKDG